MTTSAGMGDSNIFKRFKVISVEKIDYELVIKIEHIPSGECYECILSGTWHRSEVSKGDIINVTSDKFDGKTYTINDDHGLVTIDPDNLIPVGSIAKARTCVRREWLDRLFKTVSIAFDEPSFIGIIVRDIFHIACRKRPKDLSQLKLIMGECFENEDIISKCSKIDSSKEELIRKVDEFLPTIMEWLKRYALEDAGFLNDDGLSVQIGTVKDIEESIWSPSLGIVGKVSVSCEVEIHDQTSRKKLVPLTMRTGKAFPPFYPEHQDQSRLQSMLMRERGSEHCDEGLVAFLKNKKGKFESVMDLVKVNHYEETELLQRRNKLACFLSKAGTDFGGPDFIEKKKESVCEICRHRFNCSLMAKCFEVDKIEESTDFRKDFIKRELDHLEPRDMNFFKISMETTRDKWTKEAKGSPFWTEPSSLREHKKLGLGDLKIEESSEEKIILKRVQGNGKKFSPDELLGKRVAISEDNPNDMVPSKVALFLGTVTEMRENAIKVASDRRVENLKDYNKVYRLDVIDYEDLPFLYYWNLSALMSKNTPVKGRNFQRLRQCITDASKMNLDPLNLKLSVEYSVEEQEKQAFHHLDQMGGYHLFCGTPGSDETIISIVRVLSIAKKSVLITSHDSTILHRFSSKLKSFRVDFVCFGMQLGCDSDIKELTIEDKIGKARENNPTLSLEEFHQKITIAVATCSFVMYDPLFLGKSFDFSIVLEANKTPLPVILSPLFISDRFILISDENHTPPVFESEKQIDISFSGNLFDFLWRKSGGISLAHQYRMNREIMHFANQLFYNNTLQCGSMAIANAVIPRENPLWLDIVLSNDIKRSFLFLDTGSIDNLNNDDSDLFMNHIEAMLCEQMVKEFIRCGISGDEIGIITPFQRQVTLLKRMMKRSGIDEKKIFIDTIDKSQREARMVVMISLVARNDPEKCQQAVFTDERLLRIALTRASRKLILIGNRRILDNYEPFCKLFVLMGEDQFISPTFMIESLTKSISSLLAGNLVR